LSVKEYRISHDISLQALEERRINRFLLPGSIDRTHAYTEMMASGHLVATNRMPRLTHWVIPLLKSVHRTAESLESSGSRGEALPLLKSAPKNAKFLESGGSIGGTVPSIVVHHRDFDHIVRELKSLSREVRESTSQRNTDKEGLRREATPELGKISDQVLQMIDYRMKIERERRVSL
jgi:hypothetical protein